MDAILSTTIQNLDVPNVRILNIHFTTFKNNFVQAHCHETQWTTENAIDCRKRNRLQKTLYLECKSLKVDATLTVKSFHLRLYFWVVPIFTLVKTSRICWASQGETRPRVVVYNLCHVCFDFPVWAIKTFLLESLHQTVFENWKNKINENENGGQKGFRSSSTDPGRYPVKCSNLICCVFQHWHKYFHDQKRRKMFFLLMGRLKFLF